MRSLKCTESPIGSSNMARWDSLTSEKTMGRIRSPMLTALELLRPPLEGSPQRARLPASYVDTRTALVLVLAERSGIHVSVTTICRLLRQLRIRLESAQTDG